MSEPLSVLIVDDDDDARSNLRDILELDDHVVTVAASAEDALQERLWSEVDVVLLDRKLPDAVAEDLLPRLKRLAPQADIIVVTGYANMESTVAALRLGAADYIIKPINPEALRNSLHRIAKRRRIEHELHEERAFASKLFDTAEAIILVLDTEGHIVRFNPYLTELTGYTLDEVRGRDWFNLFIPPEKRTEIRTILQRTVRRVATRGVVNPILTKTGERCEIRWSNTTLRDEHGVTTGVLSVGLDVTDLIHAQEQVLQSERLATIGQTMTGLAHESRGALQRIQAALELLELQLEDNPEALRDIRKIERATLNLAGLLEEVRSYAAPIHLEREATTSLAAVWRRAWRELAQSRPDRIARLREQNTNGIHARVDVRRLEQVFRNLFENAWDACSDPVQISLACSRKENGIRISVHDNGPGIDESERRKIFDAFHTTKPTGTGLGLAIVKRIVEAHGGSINVANNGEPGTEFVIFLPSD